MRAHHQREEALSLALEGLALPVIAERLGVHRSTVWAWMQDPSVASELAAHRAQRRAVVAGELDAGAFEAVALLRQVVRDEEAPIGARIRAADSLLDRAGITPALAVEVRHADAQVTPPPQAESWVDYTRLTDEELDTVIALTNKATVRRADLAAEVDGDREKLRAQAEWFVVELRRCRDAGLPLPEWAKGRAPGGEDHPTVEAALAHFEKMRDSVADRTRELVSLGV